VFCLQVCSVDVLRNIVCEDVIRNFWDEVKKISQNALFCILEALCKLEGHEVLFLRFSGRQRSLFGKRAATPMNVYLKGMPQ
jgi:hypothetical protein